MEVTFFLSMKHYLPCDWKGHFLPGPRYLTGHVLRPTGEKAGRAEIHGCGLYNTEGARNWDMQGRLQVAVERPGGKQLRLLLC